MAHDWSLTYPGESFVFGSRDSGYGFVGAPDLGDIAWETGDAEFQNDDGMTFGRDRIGGGLISVTLDVIRDTETEARRALALARKAWRADAIRKTPSAVAMLTSGTGRSTFGRPRRFWSDDTYLALGTTTIEADFATADDLWYGPEQTASVNIAPAIGGGMVAPFVAPFIFSQETDRSTGFTVGGEQPTWPVFELEGPITNPVIEVVGVLRIAFSTTVAYDQRIVIDARPWARTIKRGATVIPATPASTRLARTALAPGRYEMSLRGNSSTGTARLTARWRDAFTTP